MNPSLGCNQAYMSQYQKAIYFILIFTKIIALILQWYGIKIYLYFIKL